MAGMIYLLPWTVALAFGRAAGRAAYDLIGRHRRKALENLTRAYGSEKSEAEIRALAKKVFENMAMTVVEIIQMPRFDFEKISRIVDSGNAVEVYRKLLREGRGLISMTAHLGNWELLAGVVGLSGLPANVLARHVYYEPYDRWIVNIRKVVRMATVYREESAKKIFKLLRKNEIVGLLPDQDVESLKGGFVPFFGQPAYTTVAPVKIALATGAPILVNFLIRQPGGRFKLVIGDVIRPVIHTTREEAVREYTAAWMGVMENMIRRYPEQWAWMHNRWKTQPAEENTVGSLEAGKAAS